MFFIFIKAVFNVILRYSCAIIWIGLLYCFSYLGFVSDVCTNNDFNIINGLLKLHAQEITVAVNIGIILLLILDNIIISFVHRITITNSKYFAVLLLAVAVCFAFIMHLIAKYNESLADWIKIEYAFMIFSMLLVMYKAESIKNDIDTESKDIKPSINI